MASRVAWASIAVNIFLSLLNLAIALGAEMKRCSWSGTRPQRPNVSLRREVLKVPVGVVTPPTSATFSKVSAS